MALFRTIRLSVVVGAALGLGLPPVAAQEHSLARQRHAWGRFEPGSIKVVRVISEQLDDKGNPTVTTTTETTSTLTKVTDQFYTLNLQTALEASGRRFGDEVKNMTQGYYGESAGQLVKIRKTGESELAVGGVTYPTESAEILITGGNTRRTSTVHGSPKLNPYILKRETTDTEGEGKAATKTTVELVAFDMPFKVQGGELCTVALLRIVETRPDGATAISYEAQSAEVPGGTVWQSTKVLDPAGKVVRRSVLELVDFYVPGQPDDDPANASRRRRLHRTRTPPSPAPEKSRR